MTCPPHPHPLSLYTPRSPCAAVGCAKRSLRAVAANKRGKGAGPLPPRPRVVALAFVAVSVHIWFVLYSRVSCRKVSVRFDRAGGPPRGDRRGRAPRGGHRPLSLSFSLFPSARPARGGPAASRRGPSDLRSVRWPRPARPRRAETDEKRDAASLTRFY